MARNASNAVAGFFPTPNSIIDLLRSCLVHRPNNSFSFGTANVIKNLDSVLISVFDPCAGDGRITRLFHNGNYMLLEMERDRYKRCDKLKSIGPYGSVRAQHGDYFLVDQGAEADVLYLNPPYNDDVKHVRLEEKFLHKATVLKHVRTNGLLLYVIPDYALLASAETLSFYYKNVKVYRFPEKEYQVYKQVIVAAHYLGYPTEMEQTKAYLRDVATGVVIPPTIGEEEIPVLNWVTHKWTHDLRMKVVDIAEVIPLLKPPMYYKGRTLLDYTPPDDVGADLKRQFNVVTPPRETHVIAALSAGALSGVIVSPNDKTLGLPDLILKGRLVKEQVEVDRKEKETKDGDLKISVTMVERSKVIVTLMNMSTGEVSVVPVDGPVRDLEPSLENINFASILSYYGVDIMREMLASCPPLHDPKQHEEFDVELSRSLFPAQLSVVNALWKVWKRGDAGGILMGEVGSGKTCTALAFAKTIKVLRTLVMCPPHLLTSWTNEIQAVLPGHDVMVLDTISDARAFANHDRPVIGLLSREKAKLGCSWAPLTGEPKSKKDSSVERNSRQRTPKCPSCGTEYSQNLNVNTRPRCDGVRITPKTKFHVAVMRLIKDNCSLRSAKELICAMDSKVSPMWFKLVWIWPELAGDLLRKSELTLMEQCFIHMLSGDLDTAISTIEESFPDLANKIHSSKDSPMRIIKDDTLGRVYLSEGIPLEFNDETRENTRKSFVSDMRSTALSKLPQKVCGEPLYTAVPSPRRWPIATWLKKHAKRSYGLLILDEAHELTADGSAQTNARKRLQGSGCFTLAMTGSLVNGYADSLFENLNAVNRKFTETYPSNKRSLFADRYGYSKFIVDLADGDRNEEVIRGSHSDRVLNGRSRRAGQAPGVVSNVLMEWVLGSSVTLQKSDLGVDLPNIQYHDVKVKPTPTQQTEVTYLKRALFDQVKRDQRDPDLAGKLYGAVTRLPSYLDLCCSGPFILSYPKSVGGAVVAMSDGLDPSLTLPKEAAVLASLKAELDRGRNVILLPWHTEVAERLILVLQREGIDVVHLEADKVPTAKRENWINANVVKPGKRVMITNPKVIQTGLNNLVHFASLFWFENPACDPIIFRQACGRIDRIGQLLTPEVFIFTYDDDVQEKPRVLLMHKVGVSRTIDGLDPEEVLLSAGVESDFIAGMSLGRQLYKMMGGS